jgi:hypothetical protein
MSILQVRKDLISFHGDEAIKDKFLSRVTAHRKADEIIQGTYWEDGKGCAVGCTLHSSDHFAYETELGIPVQLAYIQDGLFERLRNGEAKSFPEQFLQAIPIGVSLYPAYWKFMLFVLLDEQNGLYTLTENESVKKVVRSVADLYEKAVAGKEISTGEYDKIYNEADKVYWAALAALDARAALDALDARAIVWRDQLLKCLAEA